MDRMSQLPDELLLRILSNLPCTKDVVASMVLSKRWQFLRISVPKLVYDDSYQNIKRTRFCRFVDRSLLLHEATVLETLHFKLGQVCGSRNIRVWIKAANKRWAARELIIEINTCSGNDTSPVTLPRSLYTCCRMLVTLKLSNAILVDQDVSFPSLEKLSLISMTYPDKSFLEKLLSSCSVLEDLDVELCLDDNVAILSVRVPSLKSLFLHTTGNRVTKCDHGYVIDAPSLECLKIKDFSEGFCIFENNLPKIFKAHVASLGLQILLLKYITSVKRLSLCFPTSKSKYHDGSVFHRLVHLTVGTCETTWLKLLMCLLSDSPNLRALKLEKCHEHEDGEPPRPSWSEPSSVPECLLSSLETVE